MLYRTTSKLAPSEAWQAYQPKRVYKPSPGVTEIPKVSKVPKESKKPTESKERTEPKVPESRFKSLLARANAGYVSEPTEHPAENACIDPRYLTKAGLRPCNEAIEGTGQPTTSVANSLASLEESRKREKRQQEFYDEVGRRAREAKKKRQRLLDESQANEPPSPSNGTHT